MGRLRESNHNQINTASKLFTTRGIRLLRFGLLFAALIELSGCATFPENQDYEQASLEIQRELPEASTELFSPCMFYNAANRSMVHGFCFAGKDSFYIKPIKPLLFSKKSDLKLIKILRYNIEKYSQSHIPMSLFTSWTDDQLKIYQRDRGVEIVWEIFVMPDKNYEVKKRLDQFADIFGNRWKIPKIETPWTLRGEVPGGDGSVYLPVIIPPSSSAPATPPNINVQIGTP